MSGAWVFVECCGMLCLLVNDIAMLTHKKKLKQEKSGTFVNRLSFSVRKVLLGLNTGCIPPYDSCISLDSWTCAWK